VVLPGKQFVGSALVADGLGRRDSGPETGRACEWEVMSLLGDGLSTDEVAKGLFLSPTTVRVHISSVLRKLRVKDRQAAIDLLREDRT
jgi:DNA-binding NarL/FixJ family response regulator